MNNAKLLNQKSSFDGAGLVARLDEILATQRKVLEILQRPQAQPAVEPDQAEHADQPQPDQAEAGQPRIRDSRARPKPIERKENP